MPRDGVREQRLVRAEKRLGLALPAALRDYYLLAGAAAENREHNLLFAPEELIVEEGRLMFMEENQAVVTWGLPLGPGKRADPTVWQRVNSDRPEWYSEELPFSVFVLENLAWQRGRELGRTARALQDVDLARR
jgi:hypothetical protein